MLTTSGNPGSYHTPAAITRLGKAILAAVGSPDDLASELMESLIGANMAGHDSHGIQLLAGYIEGVRSGRVKPDGRATLVKREKAVAIYDGHWGWGQSAARVATDAVIALAAENGVGAVTIRNCHHIGRVGQYVEIIARAGMTGIVVCNAGPGVVPHGGMQRRLGTNPIAWAAAGSDPERPLLVDIATSTIAGNKIALARARGADTIAPGLIMDAKGEPSNQVEDFFNGGALLPAFGHKGYGLGVMVEMLGGALSGGSVSSLPEHQYGNGPLFVAFNIPAFVPAEGFKQQVDGFRDVIQNTKPAPGFTSVLLPGDFEANTRDARNKTGIPVPESTWSELLDLAAGLGLAPDRGPAD